MKKANAEIALTIEEKSIAKALSNKIDDRGKKWSQQNIQFYINIGRKALVNQGRICESIKDPTIPIAKEEEVDRFLWQKDLHNFQTGLNPCFDERLVRAREAMIIAVQVFNSVLYFRAEVFSVLACTAWTYLLLEYFERKTKVTTTNAKGRTLSLVELIEKNEAPLTNNMINNLRSIIAIRNEVVHKGFGFADKVWLGRFQSCCLNFNAVLCKEFGQRLTLTNELGTALQFSKLNPELIEIVNEYDVPKDIRAFNASLDKGLTEEQIMHEEYQYSVPYVLNCASASEQSLMPSKGVNLTYVGNNHYKPKFVVEKVKKATKKNFTIYHHTLAWQKYKVRPPEKLKGGRVDSQYCIYDKAHGDYLYSQKWIDLLIEKVKDEGEFMAIKNFGKKK